MEGNGAAQRKDGRGWQHCVAGWTQRRVPISCWLPRYTRMDAVADMIAGVTLGLTLIPQSIAYSALAGVSPQYGLNSAFMGCFVYVVFGTIKEVSIGPTSLMALLTFEYTRHFSPDFVVVLCFLVGCVEFLMGLLRLGFLVDYISVPVTSGFQTATSIIIVVSQMKGILGVTFESTGFLDNLWQLLLHLQDTKLSADFALGVSCIVFLLLMRKLKDLPVAADTAKGRALKHTLWLLCTARNFLAVVLTSTLAFGFEYYGSHAPFALTKGVHSGLPPFHLPVPPTVGNHTYTWTELMSHSDFRTGVAVVPVIAVLANVAIAKAFTTEGTVDATQEMFALSFCNILGSFFQSMPTCGAFTRSAVANASGVRTPLAGLYSGILTVLALTFLTPYFHLIPRATLSAVLISAVVFLVDWEICKPLWATSKAELVVLLATLVSCLGLGVEVGLLIGVSITVARLVYRWARPRVEVETMLVHGETSTVAFKVVRPWLGVYFPAVDRICDDVTRAGKEAVPVVVDFRHCPNVDFTAAKALAILVRGFSMRGQRLIFYHVGPKLVRTLHLVGCPAMPVCGSEAELHSLLLGCELQEQSDKPLQVLRGLPSKEAEPLQVLRGFPSKEAEPLVAATRRHSAIE